MKRSVIGASVQGASHKRTVLPCQDSYTIRDKSFKYAGKDSRNVFYSDLSDDTLILAVADGHGSSSCPFSQYGSNIATNVFCDIMAESRYRFQDKMEDLIFQFKNETDSIRIAKAIEHEWKRRVLNDYRLNRNKREEVLSEEKEKDEYAIYKLYGTTLLGMIITDEYVFSFQLGDGDINIVKENDVELMIEQEKILGIETHSLSKKGAWSHAMSSFSYMSQHQDKPFMFMLSTDGMVNSYVSEEEFHKSCMEYLSMIKEHGIKIIENNLPKWLDETSEQGCGDDTTVVMVYYED